MSALEVADHWENLDFRRRSCYRSPVEICRKPRCTSHGGSWLVKKLKNFLSPKFLNF